MDIDFERIATWTGAVYFTGLILATIVILSVILLNFSESFLPQQSGAELLGVFVNGVLTIGLLFLYYQTGKTQKEQEESLSAQADALSEQAEALTTQTEELSSQRGIMEKQQELEEELRKLILDIDGKMADANDEIVVCVSNHGGGTAQNLRIFVLPEAEDCSFGLKSHEIRLSKIAEQNYLTSGNTVGPEDKMVEMKATVSCRYISESSGENICKFSDLTTKLATDGVTELGMRIQLRAEDQHGNTDEAILYNITKSIHSNMTFREFVQ